MKFFPNLISFFYFCLSILGAILPTLANIEFVKENGPGFNIIKFIELANNNPAAQSLSFDLLILATAIFIWMFIESRRLSIKYFWLIALGTFTIAIAFSAPLFLFLRERRLYELNNN